MNKDNVTPQGKWVFDEDVAQCFDDMLARSIPNYNNMRALEIMMINNHNNQAKTLLDLGCSNGINIDGFSDLTCFGIDISVPMLAEAEKRFKEKSNIHFANYNITDGIEGLINVFGINKFDIITSVLTLQFTPIEYRQQIISDIYQHLNNNGIFIFIEKVLGESALLNKMLVDAYYQIKKQNGYSYESIDRKRKSLEGVLVPVTSSWNVDLLKQAGFKQIDIFWKCLNFEGFVAIK